MTVTKAERVYPTVWVIGDYCGWNHSNSQFLFSFSDDEINYEGMIDFGEKAANGFKLTGIGGWDDSCNWGTDGEAEAPEAEAASIKLISAGNSGNITAYSKRFYRFAFNRESLTLTKELSFDQLGIVGDGVGSWDNDIVMEFDTKTQRFWADVELVSGAIKFRADGAWDTSFGSSTEGMLDGSDNIQVPAGNYRIYVNLNNSSAMTYELNADDYGQGGGEEEPDPRQPTGTSTDRPSPLPTGARPRWRAPARTSSPTRPPEWRLPPTRSSSSRAATSRSGSEPTLRWQAETECTPARSARPSPYRPTR